VPDLSVESRFDAPRLRSGDQWLLNTRACTQSGGTVSLAGSVPRSVSGALEYRVNSTGTWTTWLPVPETDSIDFEFSASFILPAGRCANYQLRGVAIAAGDYPFSIGWSRVGSEPVDGSVGLVVIPGTSIVPANDGPEQGISCLGVGEYGVRIVRRATPTSRGGVVGELTPYSGNWARLLNATSDASVRIPLRDRNGRQSDDCDILNEIRPWRHELEIHRSGHLVWAGPILNIKADPRTGQADISAKDLSAWWAKRFLLQDFNFLGTDLATIFEAYVNYTQLVDPYGLEVTTTPTGILGDRTVIGRSVLSAANELSELDRTGVDWTIANRTAFVGGTTINGRNSRIPTVFTDESFRDPPITRLSGDGQGNDWYVKGRSDDDLGRYTSSDGDGVLIMSKRTEYSIEDKNSADAAARGAWERSHDPLTYVEGDNALASSAEVDIQELLPGVEAAVSLSGGGAVPMVGVLRLERIAVNFTEGNEEVSIYMQPKGMTADE